MNEQETNGSTSTFNETSPVDDSSLPPPSDPTRLERFSKTATAAHFSGAFHETAGFLKRKLGKLTDDSLLEEAGRNQQLLGKVHRFVGSLRGAHGAALEKFNSTRVESLGLCRKHAGKFLDVAADFVDDLKNTFLK